MKIFNKKEEILRKTLRNTEKLLNSLEKHIEERNNFEQKDDKTAMELEEEKPKLLKFKVDL